MLTSSGTVFSQDFDLVSPEQKLAQEVSIGVASAEQFEALVKDAGVTLSPFFDKNFDIDGKFGELKSGEKVRDWDEVAKGAGAAGSIFAAAYAVWRRRRSEELVKLRSGEETEITKFFEDNFDLSTEDAKLKNGTVVTDWEVLAKEKGLPAGGVLLGGLYAIWRRRKKGDKDYGVFQSIYEKTLGKYKGWREFRRQAYAEVEATKKSEVAVNIKKLTKPTPPQKVAGVETYERNKAEIKRLEVEVKNNQQKMLDLEINFAGEKEWRIKYAEKYEKWATNRSNPLSSRKTYQKFAQKQRNIVEEKRKQKDLDILAVKKENNGLSKSIRTLTSSNKKYETKFKQYQKELAKYNTGLEIYNQTKKVIRNNVAKKYADWDNVSYEFWQADYQKRLDTQNYTQNSTNLAKKVSEELANIKVAKQENYLKMLKETLAKFSFKSSSDFSKVFLAKVAEEKKTGQASGIGKRVLNSLEDLFVMSKQSNYFGKQVNELKGYFEYQTALKKLDNELTQKTANQLEMEDLEAKLAYDNNVTYKEYAKKTVKPGYRVTWTHKDYWLRNKKKIGKSSNLIHSHRFSKYAASLGQNNMSYTPEIEANLKKLAIAAHKERIKSYKGWENWYKVHPLEDAAKKKVWRDELEQLKLAEADRKAELKAQIETLKTAQAEITKNVWASKEWIESTQEERTVSSLTDDIVAAELTMPMAQISASDKTAEMEELRAKSEQLRQDFLVKEKPVYKDQFKFDLNVAIGGIINMIKKNATPEEQQRISNRYNNQAKAFHAEVIAAGKSMNTLGRMESKQDEILSFRVGNKTIVANGGRPVNTPTSKNSQPNYYPAPARTGELVTDAEEPAPKDAQEVYNQARTQVTSLDVKKIAKTNARVGALNLKTIKTESGFKLLWNSLKESTKETFINLHAPLKASGHRTADALWAYNKGEQGVWRTLGQYLGNMAGGFAGFFGQATGGAAQQVIIAAGFDDELASLMTSLLSTKGGEYLLLALEKGEAGMAWLEANDPALARDLQALLGGTEFALMFSGGSATKQSLKKIRSVLTNIAKEVEWYKVIIRNKLRSLGTDIKNLRHYFDSNNQLAFEAVGVDGKKYMFKKAELDNLSTQKSVGKGSAVNMIQKKLTDLSKSFTDPKNINRDNVGKLIKLSENLDGHTIEKHVGKSDEFLINRVKNNVVQGKGDIPSTTFHDLATAEKAIRDAFKTSSGQKMIKNAIQFGKNGEIREFQKIFDLGIDLGKGFKASRKGVGLMSEHLTKLKLVIKPNTNGGFKIITSYPI